MSESAADQSARHSAWAGVPALAGIVLLALVLRTWQLGNESAWWDEIVTLEILDAANVVEFVKAERAVDPPMTPVYFVLAYGWSRIAGVSTTAMRAFSVLLGLLSLPLTYLLARRLYNPTAGLIAAFAHAVALPHVYYSQEVRVYALITLLALLSTYGLRRGLDEGGKGWWALHLVANLLLTFTHLFALLLFVAQGCFLIAFHWRYPKRVAGWTAVHGAFLALLWLWLSTIDLSTVHEAASWMVTPGARELAMTFLVFAGGRPHNENPTEHLPTGMSLDWCITLVFAAVIGWFTLRTVFRFYRQGQERDANRSEIRALGLLICWLAVPIAILFVASYVWRPCFVYRYILYSSVPLYILLGGAISSLGSLRAKRIVLGVLVILFAHQASGIVQGPFRPDWRGLGESLDARFKPGDTVIAFQGLNYQSVKFNSEVPEAHIELAVLWSDICPAVLSAHARGGDAWIAVWLWTPPANIEACFPANGLTFSYIDFAGWPNARLYHVPKP